MRWTGRIRFSRRPARLPVFRSAESKRFLDILARARGEGEGARSAGAVRLAKVRPNSRAKVEGASKMTCEHCNAVMVGRVRKYCGRDCRDRAAYQRLKGRPAGCWAPRTCHGCGRSLGGQSVRWCSESCRAAGKPKRQAARRPRREWCRECATSITHLQRGAVFCSGRCSRRYRKRAARTALKAAGAAGRG